MPSRAHGLAAALLALSGCARGDVLHYDPEGTPEQQAIAAEAAMAWNVACGETLFVPGKGGLPIRFHETSTGEEWESDGRRRGFWNAWENIEGGGVVDIYAASFSPQDDPVEVVAHELGHALGLAHTRSTLALMHERARRPLRAGRPTEADIEALREKGYFCPAHR